MFDIVSMRYIFHHVALFMFSDLPRVLNMPVRIFLPRNMEGHIKCSVEANPPFTLIVWTKNERIIDFTHTSRLKLNKDGTLVINDVDDNDEGRYTCTPYSPLGAGRSSSVVQIHVRGQYSFLLFYIVGFTFLVDNSIEHPYVYGNSYAVFCKIVSWNLHRKGQICGKVATTTRKTSKDSLQDDRLNMRFR